MKTRGGIGVDTEVRLRNQKPFCGRDGVDRECVELVLHQSLRVTTASGNFDEKGSNEEYAKSESDNFEAARTISYRATCPPSCACG